jgi:hypothetical protein
MFSWFIFPKQVRKFITHYSLLITDYSEYKHPDHNCVLFDFIAEKVTASPKIRRTIYDTKFCRIPQQVSIAPDNTVPITSANADETTDLCNRYFNSVFLKEIEGIYRPVSPLSNEINSEITLEPCEVRIVLNNLNPNKASGPERMCL